MTETPPTDAPEPGRAERDDDAARADRDSLHPTTSPRADPDAGPTSPSERGHG